MKEGKLQGIRSLFPYLRANIPSIIVVSCLSVITAGFNLVPVRVVGTLVNLVAGAPIEGYGRIWNHLANNSPLHLIRLFAGLYVLASVCGQIYGCLVTRLGYKLIQAL